MATSLDDILDETPQKPEKPAAEPVKDLVDKAQEQVPAETKPEVEKAKSLRQEHRKKEWIAQGRDPETGQFVKDETKPEEKKAEAKVEEKPKAAAPPQQEEMTAKEKAAFAAAADERRKRQELERRLAELQPKPAPAEPPKAFWDDPEGALKRHEAAIAQTALNTRLQTAELIARNKYQDFDDKIAKFAELVTNTPGLAPQWLNSPDPAEFAYRTAKNHMELQDAGSIEQMKFDIEKRVRAEERAKVEAEFKAKAEALEKERAALPGSLSDVRGIASPRAAPVWDGPPSLDEVLRGKG